MHNINFKNVIRMELKKNIYSCIRRVKGKKKLEVNEPFFDNYKTINYLKLAVKNNELSSVGKYTAVFEKKIKKYCKTNYCLATNSGTSALHLALRAFGVNEGDEVLVPALTFVGTVNAIKYCNATPHFIDSNIKTNLGIDTLKLENYLNRNFYIDNRNRLKNKISKNLVKGIICVHVYGYPADIFYLKKIAKKYKLFLIEDAAGAFGSTYKDKKLGTIGDVGIFSFNGNKIITTGGGGAIVTNNKNIFKKVFKLGTTSKVKHKYEYIHDEVGYNYRMPSINASLGIAQLNILDSIMIKKRKLFKSYLKNFRNNKFGKIFKPSLKTNNHWLNLLVLEKSYEKKLKIIIEFLLKKKIKSKPAWRLMSSLKHFRKYPKMNLDGSKKIYKKILLLPSSVDNI